MLRTQIQLDDAQAVALKRLAAERGVSVAALIRDAVDGLLRGAGSDDRIRRALELGGRFSSGCGDIAAEHDRYLAEDLAD